MKNVLDVQRVINCSGRMTYLGSSTLSEEVIEAMNYGASNYFDMNELIREAGKKIAKHAGADDGFITCGASSGIVISVAAVITKGNPLEIRKIPNSATEKNEILLQMGHNVDFGAEIAQMITLGGGKPVLAGVSNKCEKDVFEASVSEKTAAILYVKSHHAVQDGMLSLEDVISVAKAKAVPLIIDAAAEEDFKKYLALGADMVIYSGAKAFGGPTSGCVVGNQMYIDWCYQQSKGVGRPFKVGKETIMGLYEAIEEYADKAAHSDEDFFAPLENYLKSLQGIKVSKIPDSMGRAIVRLRVSPDKSLTGKSAVEIVDMLKNGNPAIYTRSHHASSGYFEFDPRPMSKRDIPVIIEKLKAILED